MKYLHIFEIISDILRFRNKIYSDSVKLDGEKDILLLLSIFFLSTSDI